MDLTLLYITASQMPDAWMKFQLDALRRAAPDLPIVSVSRKPMDLGTNLLDDGVKSYWNIYVQMRRAAEVADTEFVAMVEDDTLYSPGHFRRFRPPSDAVSFNVARWSLFAWDKEPVYCLRHGVSNCSLIAPRQLLIDALKEREAKWPDGVANHLVGEVGRASIARRLGVQPVKAVEWASGPPIVQLNHESGTDGLANTQTKKHARVQAYDIPYWGKAKDITEIYNV